METKNYLIKFNMDVILNRDASNMRVELSFNKDWNYSYSVVVEGKHLLDAQSKWLKQMETLFGEDNIYFVD